MPRWSGLDMLRLRRPRAFAFDALLEKESPCYLSTRRSARSPLSVSLALGVGTACHGDSPGKGDGAADAGVAAPHDGGGHHHRMLAGRLRHQLRRRRLLRAWVGAAATSAARVLRRLPRGRRPRAIPTLCVCWLFGCADFGVERVRSHRFFLTFTVADMESSMLPVVSPPALAVQPPTRDAVAVPHHDLDDLLLVRP
jgi:hypothetical protein